MGIAVLHHRSGFRRTVDLSPLQTPNGLFGCGWRAASYTYKFSMFELPLNIGHIVQFDLKIHSRRTARALVRSLTSMVQKVRLITTKPRTKNELEGWHCTQKCQLSTLMVIVHQEHNEILDATDP